MKKYSVGVLGATGMVGQRFVHLLSRHPWFELTILAASEKSAGKTYAQAVCDKWSLSEEIPACARDMIVKNITLDAECIAKNVDFVFCAVDMTKEDILYLEQRYAQLECPVISNNSANRMTPDVPMVIPEINPHHLSIISAQRHRLGTTRGFIAVKSNCSLQSYVPVLHTLSDLGLTRVAVATYQAVSGAGKTLKSWPEMQDNVIPYIAGEEEKSQQEPLKIWGKIEDDIIQLATTPAITAQCFRVPVSHGHMAAVFADFRRKVPVEDIISRITSYKGLPQYLQLPSAPINFIHYFSQSDFPQTALHRDLENGMAISVGRIRPDTVFDIKLACLSHNTLRGAAGGGILLAELLCAQHYID